MGIYNLDYLNAITIIINGGAVKGENFKEGHFLRLNAYGQMVIVNVDNYYSEDTWVSLKSLSSQNFRELNVLTKKELLN